MTPTRTPRTTSPLPDMSSTSTSSVSLPASSSSTLWATPSKEWVIPAKPKPGRKPKKDPAPPPPDDSDVVDATGRRVQNRAAQRAFRERKQSQLAELQARVQQYEQGEIERNVALQNIAKRLKEENDKLRKENVALKSRLCAAEEERDSLRELSRKRWRDESGPYTPTYGLDIHARKKQRRQSDVMDANMYQPVLSPYFSSPSTVASSPGPNDHTSFSPMPSLPPPREVSGPVFPQGNTLSNIFDFIASGKSNMFEAGGPLDTFNCGFCSDNTPCVCRELALQQVGERFNISPSSHFKAETNDSSQAADVGLNHAHMSTEQSSILDNLPAYQPPVPLRRRAPRSNVAPVFPISQISPQPTISVTPTETPNCTGDPSNCPACADDAFGQAFCAAISKSVASTSPCSNCPCGSEGGCNHALTTSSNNGACCGNPEACCRARENANQSSSTGRTSPLAMSDASTGGQAGRSTTFVQQTATVPCDDVWRQIKSHPNVAFADLDLLAEVVARRAKCTGPRVEIFPAPGSITPERGISPLTLPSSFSHHEQGRPQQNMSMEMSTGAGSGIQQPMMLTHENSHHEGRADRDRLESSSPPLQLVPQEVLVQCGRQRVREVHADAVRDALRLLDAKFSIP